MRRWLIFCAVLATSSCDPLVGPDYSGEPLLSFYGQIRNIAWGEEPLSGAPLRLSLFWSPTGKTDAPLSELIEDRSVTVGVSFPSTFEIHVFQPPETNWLHTSTKATYGVAAILVYEDPTQVGRYVHGQSRLVGGASNWTILYAPQRLSADQSPTNSRISGGMHLVKAPQPCDDEVYDFDLGSDTICGVTLGVACNDQAPCAPGGVCLTELSGTILPGGYCGVRYDLTAKCQPEIGSLEWSAEHNDLFWVKPCNDTTDCRHTEGYVCDNILMACTVHPPVYLDLEKDFVAPQFCVEFFIDDFVEE